MAISLQKSARWYVYRLIDPRDQKPFYIGKGCGSRIHAHEADAARGVCSKKTFRIKDIQNAGFEVVKCFDAYFWDEQAAYDHETDVILEIGLNNLTNILPGGQKAWEKRVRDRQSKERYPEKLSEWLKKSSDPFVISKIAYWIKRGGHLGAKFQASQDDLAKWGELRCRLTEFAYNEMLPKMWEKISNDADFRDALVPRLKEHGIEVVYGGA